MSNSERIAEDLQELTNTLANINIKDLSMKKELDEIVQEFKNEETLPDIIDELIMRRKLNTMIIDLYDYDKGYSISFRKFGDDKEMFHGEYSYAVSVIEYIGDGQIPYELFDNLYNYEFKIFYDGYVICQLRIHFGQEDCMRSHFVLLKQSIQTIDAECLMKCKADKSLNYEAERARLIKYYSPDLCLDPDPVVAEIVISNELNQHPFLTPYMKHIIQNEKARREKGIQGMKKPRPQESASRKLKTDKQENWNFRLNVPTKEEMELAKLASNLEYDDSLKSYLRDRPICFPDKESFTGFPVEIENFVYEYDGNTSEGGSKSITDKFCIAVVDEREYYYGAYQLDERMKEKRTKPCNWWRIGGREELDSCINSFTREEMKLFRGGMKITHNRMFDEKFEFPDGKIKMTRRKFEVPVCQVVLHHSPPSSDDEDEEEEEEEMDEN